MQKFDDLTVTRLLDDIPDEWTGEPDIDRFEAYGLRCVVVRVPRMGHLCGYVGLKPGHPLYRVRYNEPHETLDFLLKRRLNSPISSSELGWGLLLNAFVGAPLKPTIENVLSVHGGVTFSEPSHYCDWLGRGRWWIGFDCAHAGDLSPGMIASCRDMQIRCEDRELFRRMNGVYRRMEWVRAETERLAAQLSIFKL